MTTPFRSRHHREILLADWRDAEDLAAWYMREILGMQGARTTGSGNDQGIDVVSDLGVAQVKHVAVPIGAPMVQSALGAGHGNVAVLFFSLSGFTRQAEEFADRAGVALFGYDIYGDVRAGNENARVLVTRGGRERTSSVEEVRLNKLKEKARPAVEKLEKCRNEVEAFASELERTTGLESDNRTLACVVGEYAQFLKTRADGPVDMNEALENLDDARAGRTRIRRVRNTPELIPVSAVEAGCRGLIALYEEIADIESLRRLTPGQWVRKFFDWEIRREHIKYLIKYTRFSPFEKEPPLEAMKLKSTIELDIGGRLNSTIASRWLQTEGRYGRSRWRNPTAFEADDRGELSSYVAAAEKDPVGWEPDYCKGLLEHFWSVEFEDADEDIPPAYPLGCEPRDIERLREALDAS